MYHRSIPYSLVDNQSDLRRTADTLSKENVIGVDLEADSMFHYRERVCLLQISTPTKNTLIDPLSTGDLSPLFIVFSNPNIRKIFHGADYDIRSLYRDFDIEVNSLFDTQIAARFLGTNETSLAGLLKERFGLVVEKKYQKKDWSKRPLPAPMLSYAVQDSCHLISLSKILEEELRKKKRLSWVLEECELLSNVRPAPANDGPLFLKFKGAGKLEPRCLAVLEALLQFREELARKLDRPPLKVLRNDQIMEIALERPLERRELKWLSSGQMKMMGQSILKKTNEAMSLPHKDLPEFPKLKKPSLGSMVSKRINMLKQWREEYAGKLELEPSLLCTNAQIQALAIARPIKTEQIKAVDGIKNWQRKLFGREICTLLKTKR